MQLLFTKRLCRKADTTTNLPAFKQSYNTGQIKKKKMKNFMVQPPFSEHVKTNIGRIFLNLLEKQFPPRYRFRKICNKNTVKISYSCMPNMAAILSRHNKTVLASKNTNEHPPCNCRHKAECFLNGDCRKKAVVYKASISTDSNDPPKSYYGCCKTEFIQ